MGVKARRAVPCRVMQRSAESSRGNQRDGGRKWREDAGRAGWNLKLDPRHFALGGRFFQTPSLPLPVALLHDT